MIKPERTADGAATAVPFLSVSGCRPCGRNSGGTGPLRMISGPGNIIFLI